jgi:hypothetical protein
MQLGTKFGETVLQQSSNSTGLASAKADLERFQSISAVTDNVRTHYENLERLAASLRQLGMDELTIDENVIALFAEYNMELAKAINRC